MHSQQIIYERDAVCLPCWTGYKPATFLERSSNYQEEPPREPRDKKISLKRGSKPSLRGVHQNTESIRSSIMEPYQLPVPLPLNEVVNEHQVRSTHQAPHIIIRSSTLLPTEYTAPKVTFRSCLQARPSEPKITLNVHKPIVKWNIMETTTKKNMPEATASEELIKTKKNQTPSHKFDLKRTSDLKVSICSIPRGETVERMQESEVMLDYFHPSESKVKEIQKAISGQVIREQDSFEL